MVAVAVLAAGRGTRMRSEHPKVLHSLSGRSMVERVLDSCEPLQPERCFAIVGYGADRVRQALQAWEGVEFVEQAQQLGTGHALRQLEPHLTDFDGDLLVLNGDVPLLRPETLQRLLQVHQRQQNAATLLTVRLPDPSGYGRVFCDEGGIVRAIVEDKDCTPEQKATDRINAGIYCFSWRQLAPVLPKLSADNAKQEYYLTEAIDFLQPVMAVDASDPDEIAGINDRAQLAAANDSLQARIKQAWMAAGVTMVDPASITIDETVRLQPDVVLEPQTHLRGHCAIGAGSRIGPGTWIDNSHIGEGATVWHSTIRDSTIAEGAQIGPYAHVRGRTQLAAGCRVGNFVEIKNTQVGANANVAHLSYLGDATLGRAVNVGAGTIVANYDGRQKHASHIGDSTKTGANSVLVAPVALGDGVTVGAGSVVTDDVPHQALVVARARQVVKENWQPEQNP